MDVLELKTSVGGFTSRLRTAEQRMSGWKNPSDENIQREAWR